MIDLIRIVPLGQKVEAKIPGGVRLGATNPSKFKLDFFVNDLTKQNSHTFADLGKFDYSEKATDFSPSIKIHTDGLLLRGNYRTLTLAILGQTTSLEQMHAQQQNEQNVLPSPPAQTPASPVISEREASIDVSNSLVRTINDELISHTRRTPESIRRELIKDALSVDSENVGVVLEDALMTLVSSAEVPRSGGLEEISSSDEGLISPRSSPQKRKEEELEEISSSDDESPADLDKQEKSIKSLEMNGTADFQKKSLEGVKEHHEEWKFDPLSYRAEPLLYFADPSMTNQERNIQSDRLLRNQDTYAQNLLEMESKRILEDISKTSRDDNIKTDEWVLVMEDIIASIDNLSMNQCLDNSQVVDVLVEQVCCGLDFDLALQQPQTVFKVRHIKAGLKLASVLFHCDELSVTSLLKYEIPKKALMLYHKPNMSLPIRLQIIRCLDAACDSLVGIQTIMFHKYEWPYQECKRDTPSINIISNRVKEDKIDGDCTTYTGCTNLNNELSERKVGTRHMTCYQFLLSILLESPPTRVVVAIGSLFKKITLFESLNKLSKLVEATSGTNAYPTDAVTDAKDYTVLLSVLRDIVQLVEDDCANIAQPIRYLPAKNQFHVKPCRLDPYMAVYKWIKHFRTLDKINDALLQFRKTEYDYLDDEKGAHNQVQDLCLNFVRALLSSPRGLHLFLSSDFIESTNNLLDILLLKQNNDFKELENSGSANKESPQSQIATKYYNLGIKSAYSFKMYYCIDKLFDFHREVISGDTIPEDAVPEPILHQIFILSDHPYGREALLKHFSCGGNLDCLLRFLEMPDIQREVDSEFNKETCIEYSLEILEVFFQLNESVLEMSDEYLETMTDLCKNNNIIAARVRPLLQWLTPYDIDRPCLVINYSEESFKQLLRVVRRSVPTHSKPFADGLDFKLPTQLITTIRILRQLCIPPQVEMFLESIPDTYSRRHFHPYLSNYCNTDTEHANGERHVDSSKYKENEVFEDVETATSKLFYPYDDEICGNLKYHYGITQVFEHEGLKRLLVILKELNGNYSKPIYQSAALSGLKGQLVLSFIKSVILLIQSIVSHSIDARGSEFKDTSAISVILETYSLISFVPKSYDIDTGKHSTQISSFNLIDTNNVNCYSAKQIQYLILCTLMGYTQMCLSVSEEKVISKSVWAKMLQEIIDFTLSAPIFFYSGLEIFTKILPKPLQTNNTIESLDQEQLFKHVNHRKLWSAHLHPLHSKIEQMISYFSISCQPKIRTQLLYLCNQLCDLSTTTACTVAKSVFDSLINYSCTMFNDDKENAYSTRMTLNFLATLMTNKSFDSALTNHLQVTCKKDEKINQSLQNLIRFLCALSKSERSDELMSLSNSNSNTTTVDVSIYVRKTRMWIAESIAFVMLKTSLVILYTSLFYMYLSLIDLL